MVRERAGVGRRLLRRARICFPSGRLAGARTIPARAHSAGGDLAINSIGRGALNATLLDAAEATPGVAPDLLARYLAQQALDENYVRPTKRIFDNSKVSDHFAIIPTTQAPSGLSEAEQKLYDLVVRRFMAVFFPKTSPAIAPDPEAPRGFAMLGEKDAMDFLGMLRRDLFDLDAAFCRSHHTNTTGFAVE